MSSRFVVALLLFFSLSGVAFAAPQEPLRVHAWVDYFPAWLTEEFTAETGIPVLQTFFADNTTLYRNLVNDGPLLHYDVVTPSAELVQQLAVERLLRPLPAAQIPNRADLDPWFLGLAYDNGCEYSIPLFWGVIGLVIDKRVVPADLAAQITGYADLRRPEFKGKILLPNDFRSVMSIMLLSLGYSVNDSDPDHLAQAMHALETLAPAVRTFDTVDQVESMLKVTTAVGVVWGREQYDAPSFADIFSFLLPKEGSPLWIDTLAIPASAGNPEAACRFIDFVLRPENLAKLSESSGYAIAGKKAQTLVRADLLANRAVYPPLEVRDSFEVELRLPPAADAFLRRWTRIRNGL